LTVDARRVRAGTLDALILGYMHITLPTLAPSTARYIAASSSASPPSMAQSLWPD
jgi:hypothetical protein